MGKKHQEGFTLIELLVLMMVFALTLGIGVPAFSNMITSARMSSAGNDLVGSLLAARAEAMTRNRTVTLCASSDPDAAQPGCDAGAALLDGWIVFVDGDSDGTVDAGELVVQAHGPVHDDIRGQARSLADAGPPQYVSFRGDGFLEPIAALGDPVRNIQLCDGRGNVDTGSGRAAGRWIAIAPAGRPTLVDQVERLQGPNNPLGGC